MNIKKILTAALIAVLTFALAACGSKKSNIDLEDDYDGILTKVRLGMPLSQVAGMQRVGVTLYYETDRIVWSNDPDIELMQLKSLLPASGDADQMLYYVDDTTAIITYYFKAVPGREELLLKGFSEEVSCLLNRETGNAYFRAMSELLMKRHNPEAELRPYMIGVEGVDKIIVTSVVIDCPSYDVTFSMTETYDEVNGIADYYVTHFKIALMEKEIKDPVAVK